MPDRYADDAPSAEDSPIMLDGDTAFYALDSRRSPEELPATFVQQSQNGRMNQGVWQVRKGMAKQTNGISFTSVPLIIPFTVGNGAVIVDVASDGILGSLMFSDPNGNDTQYIILATGTKAYLWSPGGGVVSINYPTNETVSLTDTVDMFQAGGAVYLLRGLMDVQVSVTSITSSSTTATVTTTAAHGYSSNQWVRISGSNYANYNGDFQITVTGSTTFTYTMPGTATSPSTGTIVLVRLKIPLKWDGNQSDAFVALNHGAISSTRIYMPPSNFGLLQMNRAILQYGRNSIIVSDVLNPESYDPTNGLFNFATGWSDYILGAHPYQDNQTLIFLRRSIYLLNGINGDVAAMTSQILTQQVGCVARRSIATCGANVLFLSDLGVFMLQPGYELTLRGNSEPLSAPIDPVIQTINFSATGAPCAAYCNNRYYLAVPINGSARNNTMLVYNFINEAWESTDTFPNGFYADYLVVMNLNNVSTLFVMSREGGIYAYEQNEQDDFAAAQNPATQYLINGVLRTRRLIFGSSVIKRFDRCIVNYKMMDANASISATANLINPALTKSLPLTMATTAGTITRPMIIGKRGYGLELSFTNTNLRSQVTNYSVRAHDTGLKGIKSM